MASKPEAQYIRSVHKHLDTLVYHEGMANPYRGGTPDRWYEGHNGKLDLWVEYKYMPKLPPVIDLLNKNSPSKLSGLQKDWLKRAFDKGRNVAVILGTPKGGYIYRNLQWELKIKREVFQQLLLPRKEIAAWIANEVT